MKRRSFILGITAGIAAAGAAAYTYRAKLIELLRGVIPAGKSGTPLDPINHVVVVMLENRSFDNVLGKLKPKSADFDGLTGNEINPDLSGKPVMVHTIANTGTTVPISPAPDPGELFADITEQVYGTPTPTTGQAPTMDGFVRNFLKQPDVTPDLYAELASRMMHVYEPSQVPVISQLARQFAVCDRWFASAPCQTWPNRFFLHSASAGGYADNEPYHLLDNPTIFKRIGDVVGAEAWAIYYHDFPLALNLRELWSYPLNFFTFNTFLDDAKAGKLPAYSFIEPRYLPGDDLPNDQHPPTGVDQGELLLAAIYNALRQSPNWTSTLLIITYDEHGGCFDHVPPPAAAPPDATPAQPFNFDRFGVRVPTVIVSPYIKSGVTMRAPASGPPFDHTSVIATLRKRFNLGAPLSKRDAVAPDLGSAADAWLAKPDNLGPDHIDATPVVAVAQKLSDARQQPVSDLQRSILHVHANLPDATRTVAEHKVREAAVLAPASPAAQSAGNAADTVKGMHDRLRQFRTQ
jgi:phospholipase C